MSRRAAAGAALTLAVLAACGSSGSGTVTGTPPTPSPEHTQTFTGSGITLTVPDGFVLATTPAQAAERFPDVLGTDAQAQSKIADAEGRLRKNAILLAFHQPVGGLSDNVSLLKIVGAAPSNPAEIQSLSFQKQARTSLANANATNIVFTETTLGNAPAERVTYTITLQGAAPVNGEQLYVAAATNVFVLTVTGGTKARAEGTAAAIADSWRFG